MATSKRITDLSQYTNILPYASELFGVYQPFLGWKSKRMEKRFKDGFNKDRFMLLEKLKNQFSDLVNIELSSNRQLLIDIKPGIVKGNGIRFSDSLVLEKISIVLPKFKDYKMSVWSKEITPEKINSILTKDVVKFYSEAFSKRPQAGSVPDNDTAAVSVFRKQLQYESSISGALLFLVEEKSHSVLEKIFYSSMSRFDQSKLLIKMITSDDSSDAFLDIDNLDPTEKEQLKAVSLSPISIVHLFRQYFFELDTFLGSPESHVWLSPGSSVELIEEQTRKNIIEKSFERSMDIFTKSEKKTTLQDDISDAVSEENSNKINLGASVTAKYASIKATSSFDYESSQNNSREKTHKTMRRQTEKLSSEIRKNFKTTFRTVTEFTDFSSTKHILRNDTKNLINYELRRKMRQVGVQVQDIGSYLCWQTYVDDPGSDLGLAKLIHIAQSAELNGLQHPEAIPMFQAFQEEKTQTIPFISISNAKADNKGEVYVDGVEVDNSEFLGRLEKIQSDFTQDFISPKSNYELTFVEFDALGLPVTASMKKDSLSNVDGRASFVLHLDSADFKGKNSIQIKLVLHWSPNQNANDDVITQNRANIENFKAAEKVAYEKAYLETVKDRVTVTSNITARKSEDLREEERIVIYRKLIQDFLQNKISLPDDRTRHVVAELINSIFDVDKMLYFVAPEWWRPRLHRSKQQLYETAKKPLNRSVQIFTDFRPAFETFFTKGLKVAIAAEDDPSKVDPSIMVSNTVGWGDIDDTERDNYYITEDSSPAKFGSSLGWLLQLDGDSRRNVFLNAPWVKAVMPIRPGKEKAAINWLKAVDGMTGITDDVIYHASNPDEKDINGEPLEGQKVMDVIIDLANKIEKKHQQGIESGQYPKASEVSVPELVDEENVVTATPIDRVYEHGFYPLEKSFRANIGDNYEIFDQWIEILPTDQTVPVEVQYDPVTGRQI